MIPNVPESDWIYDIETFKNIFSADITHVASQTRFIFEVSDRRNQSAEFVEFIYWLRDIDARMFGFNNLGFDWPVVDHLIKIYNSERSFTAMDAHRKANAIINAPFNDRFTHAVWPSDRIVRQADLMKIHHFDNMAKLTSLKKIEINQRARRVVDLPYDPSIDLTFDQMDHLISYMCHDVRQTMAFYLTTLPQINFRDTLREQYPELGDVINFNDTKIGKKFFEVQLEAAGTRCHHKVNGKKTPIQTIRERIVIGDILSPKLSFSHPEFQRIHTWFSQQSIRPDQTKGFFKGITANVEGFEYVFGLGGIHGSKHKTSFHADDEWEIWDWDVASYYPNIAITHNLYPAHLSERFCGIYQDMYNTRKEYAKNTAENAMYKLGLNGVYGDSNNKHSIFYDPQYTMAVTINGQLLLCLLSEQLTVGNDLIQMLQINTDGLTVKVHKSQVQRMHDVCDAWQKHTGLTLESAEYSDMFVRDVNSYLAIKTNGDVKRIGAYRIETPLDNPNTRELGWHQDQSALVVTKAVDAYFTKGTPIEDFIRDHRDPYDFQLSVKVPRNSRLEHGADIIQNTSRYYVSTTGSQLTKVMPPLEGKDVERRISVQAGWTVTVTNDMLDFDWSNVNLYYYVTQAKALIVEKEG